MWTAWQTERSTRPPLSIAVPDRAQGAVSGRAMIEYKRGSDVTPSHSTTGRVVLSVRF